MFFSIFLIQSKIPIGALPDTWEKYNRSINLKNHSFTCFDKSTIIDLSRLNDNYLDCPDGSDEPGTSAYSDGLFYCKNEGFFPKILPKWSIGDGICDCCDGSDEHFSFEDKNICNNTCPILREQRNSLLKILEEGIFSGTQMYSDLHQAGSIMSSNASSQFKYFKSCLKKLKRTKNIISHRKAFRSSKSKSDDDPLPFFKRFKNFFTILWRFTFRTPNRFPIERSEKSKIIDQLRKNISNIQQQKSYWESILHLSSSFDPAFLNLFGKEIKSDNFRLLPLQKVKKNSRTIGKFEKIKNGTMYFTKKSCLEADKKTNIMINLQCWNSTFLSPFEEKIKCNYQANLFTPNACYPRSASGFNNLGIEDLQKIVNIIYNKMQ